MDKVFLYPGLREKMLFKRGQISNPDADPNILSYYHGSFLRFPKQICKSSKCHLQKSVYHTSGYHLRVFYPTQVIQPVHVETQAVAYPTGHNIDKIVFASFRMNFGKYAFISDKDSHSWLSLTIYHINCLKDPQQTTNWS